MDILVKASSSMRRFPLIWLGGLLFLFHALVLLAPLKPGVGALFSNIIQFTLGMVAISAAYLAGRRSGPFGRQVWLFVTMALAIWTLAQGIITVYDSVLHASYHTRWPSDPLVFFWVVPLFMALFLFPAPGRKHLDPVQLFDFAQILILAMAAYLAFLFAPSEWEEAGRWMARLGWDATNLRDLVLAGGLTIRALVTRGKLVPSLFRRLAGFFVLYQVADLVYHYKEEVANVTTGSPWDLLWSAPIVAAIAGASTWNQPDEAELASSRLRRRFLRQALYLSSAFLPLPVLLVAVRVHLETPTLGAALVGASLLSSGARFLIAQRRRDQGELLRSALFRIAEKANSCQITQELCAEIHATLGELMYARNFYVALADEPSQTLTFVYFQDEVDTFHAGPVPMGRGLTEYVLRDGEPLLAGPERFRELLKSGEVETVGVDSVDWLGVPLKRGDKAFGVLVVQSYDGRHRYGEKDREVLTFMAQHLASFIERKRNEDAVRQSEARYRSLFERNLAGVFRSTLDGKFLDFNPAFARMFGYTREELLVLPAYVLCPGAQAEYETRMAQYRQARQSTNDEVCYQRKDGGRVWAIQNVSVFEAESGNEVCEGTVVDVTERHKLEDQFRQSQKMEAIGLLAGGVAHDFNNMLMVIEGHADFLMQQLSLHDPRRADVVEIQDAAARAAALTHQLLAFSRKQVLAPKLINLNKLVEDAEKMLRRVLGEQIKLSAVCAEDLWMVKADPGQIGQVIMNLAVNARDAMPSGGRLTLETANTELDPEYCRNHVSAKPGPHVMLAVSDTGHGMDRHTQARIFEPFFTTKERGKGTGLGLSTVYGIVKQNDGHIWVYSEVGHGTTFKIYLPQAVEPAPGAEPVDAPDLPPGGAETILVVEDEIAVRKMLCNTLAGRGYRVLAAPDAQRALALAERTLHSIDLLLTDMFMPGKGGHELAAELLRARPDLKVLYISGYADIPSLELGGNKAFLQKPFTSAALTRKVRDLLDSGAR